MTSMFKGPKQQPQKPQPDPIPAPSRSADEVATLAASQKARYNTSGGRASNLLTGGGGAGGAFASAASLLGEVGR